MKDEKMVKTGYSSIDKPWLKYYSEEAINTLMPERTVYEHIWENNKEHLDEIALHYFDRKITYFKLFENIEKVAKAFTELGLKEGDVVILATVTIPETIYAFYALNKIGVISNMVDPRTSVEGLREYIYEANVKYILTLDACYPKILDACIGTNVEKIIVTSPANSLSLFKKIVYTIMNYSKNKMFYESNTILWSEFVKKGMNKVAMTAPYIKDNCCVIVHTGGTTGTPKGVMLSNECLNSAVVQCDKSGFDFQRKHKMLGIMPPFIAYGICNNIHLPLSTGMSLVVLPKFDPNEYDTLLLKHKPNHIAGVPSHYNAIIHSNKLKNADLSFICSPVVGGDGTEIHFEKAVNDFLSEHNCSTRLIKGYGMTEVCAAISTTSQNRFNKLGSVGIPFTHSVISVFDMDMNELPIGEIGEICMRAPHVMLGYHENTDETSKILKKHDDGYVWIHSGDLGYIDEDGCVFIKGRIKRMIVRYDGFKVYPTQIESVVASHEAVKACCVVGTPDKEKEQGKLPVVFAVLNNGYDENIVKKDLISLCSQELAEYAQPIDYRFIDKIPLTAIGKVDYRTLEENVKRFKWGVITNE